MKHRIQGLGMLSGHGLEIGAMHNPSEVPDSARVDYFDVVTREEARALFPEVSPDAFKIDPTYLGDLDKDGLGQIRDGSFDFVILNHVIEHVANPIRVVGELFRVVRIGGQVLISCPDKRFTFDRDRELTSFDHLRGEYESGITHVTDDHYLDFLAKVHPEVMSSLPEVIARHVENVRRRREHAHVWNSESFREFLGGTFKLLGIQARCRYESVGDANNFEYFSVWVRLA